MIELQTETVILNGKSIAVSENDWDMSRKLNRLTEEAKLSVNGGTSALDYFRKHFYPILASVSSGDVPGVEEAFDLVPDELDGWFMAVWKTNPDWFTEPMPKDFEWETITFRDGSQLELIAAKGRPSFMLRLVELENDAAVSPSDDPDTQLFQSVFYPKMAACVVGDCPDATAARKMPTTEINKWYEAAKRLNPDWFMVLDDMSEEAKEFDKQKKKAKVKK